MTIVRERRGSVASASFLLAGGKDGAARPLE
jgi:hypothetical protein